MGRGDGERKREGGEDIGGGSNESRTREGRRKKEKRKRGRE